MIVIKKDYNMGNLHMRIGNQLGEILLQTAQEKIKNGECQKAIELYTDSLHGFTEEYVGKVLRNEMVLVTDEDGVNMNLVDDTELIEKNKSNMYDWWSIVKNEIEYIDDLRDYRIEIMEKFHNVCRSNIENVNIREVMLRYMDEEQLRHYGAYNIAAKLIANKPFSRLASNGEHTWNRICARNENDEAYKYEQVLYYLVKYNEVIRKLFNTYMKIANTYKFLEKHQLIEHYPFIELTFERVIEILNNYSDTNHGYYHPMCDSELYYFKEQIYEGICKTSYGLQYVLDGILEKNISDGYDAGWLSPTGEFYGGNGSTGDMIHMIIAEKISKHREWGLKIENHNPDYWLESHGWIKIHHDNVYGLFNYKKEEPKEDFSNLYIPTDIQIKKICEYIDNIHNGQFYTEYPCFGKRTHRPDPITTYKLKQMDEIQLHKIFYIWE